MDGFKQKHKLISDIVFWQKRINEYAKAIDRLDVKIKRTQEKLADLEKLL